MSLSIEIIRDCELADLPNDSEFERWARLACSDLDTDAELCISLVSPEESQRLNREYRGQDKPTNVLSFPGETPPGLPFEILGDLAICAEVVQQEARAQSKPELHHWAHLTIHGVLHLQGFDHIKDGEAEEMESLEIELLAQLGIPDPYQSED